MVVVRYLEILNPREADAPKTFSGKTPRDTLTPADSRSRYPAGGNPKAQ